MGQGSTLIEQGSGNCLNEWLLLLLTDTTQSFV